MNESGAKITAVVNTYNADQYLDRVLDALAGFDEIVVCDMESTDSTLDIARSHGAKIVTFPRGELRICEPARNTAIRAASSEWVFVVDADEIVTPELRDYLYSRIANPDCPDALWVPLQNMFMGEFYGKRLDYHIRFMRRDRVNWPPTIHSVPEIDGRVEFVPVMGNVKLLHLDDADINRIISKNLRYTDTELVRRSAKHYGIMALLFRPMYFFFKSYILRGGFRQGRRGILKAKLDAIYQSILMCKFTERDLRKNA